MKIAVCDDNIEERDGYIRRLTRLAESLSMPISVVPYDNGKQMLFAISDPAQVPEVIYLDINMPDMSGVDVAQMLRTRNYNGEIVFLTCSENYWKPAFDVHAYQYIVKGDCSEKKFASVFYSVVKAVSDKNEEYMLFSSCGEVVSIPVKDIRYFEVINRIITVHHNNGDFEFYSTLSKLEEQLSNRGFIRVHKSYLVPGVQIAAATYRLVMLKDNTQIPVGRAYQKNLRAFFNTTAKDN